jgi:protein PsiE
MFMPSSKWIAHVIRWSQLVMNLNLVAIMLVLVWLMLKEVGSIALISFRGSVQVHEVMGEIVNFFLYFAFLSTIVVYFKEQYHFPIRYLLYIGITATLRFIIINRDNALQNVLLSIVIVLLICGYLLLSPTHKGKSAEG